MENCTANTDGEWIGVCLRGKLNSFSDISQNSMLEKQTLNKIQCEKTDSTQNSVQEKQTLHKIQYDKNRLYLLCTSWKTDKKYHSFWSYLWEIACVKNVQDGEKVLSEVEVTSWVELSCITSLLPLICRRILSYIFMRKFS